MTTAEAANTVAARIGADMHAAVQAMLARTDNNEE